MNLIDELKRMKKKGQQVIGISYVLKCLRESQGETISEKILIEPQKGA